MRLSRKVRLAHQCSEILRQFLKLLGQCRSFEVGRSHADSCQLPDAVKHRRVKCFHVLFGVEFVLVSWLGNSVFFVSSQGKLENQVQLPKLWMQWLWSISRDERRLEVFCWNFSPTIMGTQIWNLYEMLRHYCQFQKCGFQVSDA